MALTFGARLRSERERQHIDLAAIASETKISVALLEGLERDDLSRWPGGLFRRAYVRAYAQKIGLDPEQVVHEFTALHPDPIDEASPVEAVVQASEKGRPRTRIGMIMAGLAGLRPQRQEATGRLVTSDPPTQRVFTGAVQTPVNVEDAPSNPPLRLMMVGPPAGAANTVRDGRLERRVSAVARLCARIACGRDVRDVSAALEETVAILEARGAVLWLGDPDRDVLTAALAHGYPEELLSTIPEVRGLEDNAVATAFRSGKSQVVSGSDDATGAFVVPLVTPTGCAGVLALEFSGGGEQHESCQSLATLVTAQLSTLFAVAPSAAADEEWEQTARSLVAS